MSKLRMVRKDKPEHGPVRRITDPAELARLGEKYATKAKTEGQVLCTGNAIMVMNSEGKQMAFSDRHISRVLEIDAARPGDQRLPPNQRRALSDLRRMLSLRGAAAFTPKQCNYLCQLIKSVTHPSPKKAMTPEERGRINRHVHAFFECVREKNLGFISESTIGGFFCDGALVPIIEEVAQILRPYGKDAEAMEFVLTCADNCIRGVRDHLRFNEIPPVRWYKELFRMFSLESKNDYCGYGVFLSKAAKKLRVELDGVPPSASEVVEEKLDHVADIAFNGFENPMMASEISAGSPGSGRGGVNR